MLNDFLTYPDLITVYVFSILVLVVVTIFQDYQSDHDFGPDCVQSKV